MRFLRSLVVLAVFAVVLLLPVAALTYSTGAPFGRAGAPPYGNTCSASGCHASFALDSGPGTLSLETASTYTPGEALTLRVRMTQAAMAKAGYQLTVVDAQNTHVGTFALPDGASKQADALGQYVTHSADGTTLTGTDERVWEVLWTPPADAGPVTVYAAAVAADGNRTASGDHVYTAHATLQAATVTAREAPATTQRFVLDGAYPNPTASAPRLRFALAQAEPVVVRLYDALGRTVRSLDLGVQPAGAHEILLPIDELAAGPLFYEVATPTARETRSLLLVK